MSLPILGVALKYPDFAPLRDWVRDHDRAIEIQDFLAIGSLQTDQSERIAAWNAALKGHKGAVGIHGPFLGLDLANPDTEIRPIIQRRLLTALEYAEKLRATHMVVHSPFTKWHVLNRMNMPSIRPSMMQAMAECLAPVLARAADIGCVVMLENVDDTDPTDRVEFVAMINHPALRVSLDTGHADLAHGQYGAAPVVDFIAAAGEWLSHVHLQDVDGYADRHWHPLEGRIPWPAVFHALAKLPRQPRLLLEVKDRFEQLPQTVARLQALGLAQ